jgi:hypothetical protein
MTKDLYNDKVVMLQHEPGDTNFVDKHEDNVKHFFSLPDLNKHEVHIELSKTKPFIFTESAWRPESHTQAENRILRVMYKQPKPKIVRENRYYVKADMVGLDLPRSFKFRTKREGIKYWSRRPVILRSAKQCSATSPYARMMMYAKSFNFESQFRVAKVKEGVNQGDFLVINPRSTKDNSEGQLIVQKVKSRSNDAENKFDIVFPEMKFEAPDA